MASNGLATFCRVFGVLTAVLTIACGLAHVIDKFDKWCQDGGSNSCVGPALTWGTGKNFIDDVNGPAGQKWRSVFTLVPEVFFDLWTPFFLGLATLLGMHFESMRIHFISANFARATCWYTFLAFWGCFGYAGSLGVITGFIAVFTATLCFVAALLKDGNHPGASLGGLLNRPSDGYRTIS